MLEHVTGVTFQPEEVADRFLPEREGLTVAEWVRRVVDLVAERAA